MKLADSELRKFDMKRNLIFGNRRSLSMTWEQQTSEFDMVSNATWGLYYSSVLLQESPDFPIL